LWQRWWARHEGIRIEPDWYCSLDCFQAGLFGRLEQAALAGPRSARRANRLPLGLILLSQGDITSEQLRQALARQSAAKRGRIGEWLVEMGAVTEAQVTGALAAQQGCPMFPMPEPQRLPERMYWPELLAQHYGAAPVFHDPIESSLYVGFRERVDHGFLLSLEQMLHCRTRPCILPPAAYRRQLELRALLGDNDSIVIHQPQNGMEMTRTISNYAEQVHAERCAIARCGERLWTRLEPAGGRHVDFLFRLPTMA
jgi:hypothetical protein